MQSSKPILAAQVRNARDAVYYGDVLPPVGSQQLSFARFLELLTHRRVKRIILLADGTAAIVEVVACE